MRALSRLVAFALMSLLLSLPVLGGDDKDKKSDSPKNDVKKDADKNDNDKKPSVPQASPRKGQPNQSEDDPSAAEKKKMQPSSLRATVVAVVGTKKSLRLRVPVPYVKANNYGKLQLATKNQEVEWTVMDDVKVRLANPPPQFDDKGRPKRYTAKELRELKGNDRSPGYPADLSDLKRGQIVQVTVLQKKIVPRAPKRGKGGAAELSRDNLPKISLIIILAEPKN